MATIPRDVAYAIMMIPMIIEITLILEIMESLIVYTVFKSCI